MREQIPRALKGKQESNKRRLSGSYFASRARAIIAAAMGADADVPV